MHRYVKFMATGRKQKLEDSIKFKKDIITIQSKMLTADRKKLFVIECSNLKRWMKQTNSGRRNGSI